METLIKHSSLKISCDKCLIVPYQWSLHLTQRILTQARKKLRTEKKYILFNINLSVVCLLVFTFQKKTEFNAHLEVSRHKITDICRSAVCKYHSHLPLVRTNKFEGFFSIFIFDLSSYIAFTLNGDKEDVMLVL